MIRFLPDSWVDALMRPIDMISPEGNIYVEVPAPDVRLAAAILLGVAVLVTSGRARPDRRPALQLLGITVLAMIPWFATTGNGRYFTAFLLLLGPLCVGLIRLLPLSGSLKIGSAGLLLLVQAVLVAEASPWGTWSLVQWRNDSYFHVAAPPAEPRSYVTFTPISYSLIAPRFPEQSRWMNVGAPTPGPREREYARQWLAAAKSLYLVAPSYASQMVDGQQPSPGVVRVFNGLIAGRGLVMEEGARCDFLPSRGVADMQHANSKDPRFLATFGFWLCPLRQDASVIPVVGDHPEADRSTDAVFEQVEKLCPRFFPAGEARTERTDGGVSRHYSTSDTRLYVLDDGEVLYKFWRSLNAGTIGTRDQVLAGQAQLDCSKIRAPTWRSGGP